MGASYLPSRRQSSFRLKMSRHDEKEKKLFGRDQNFFTRAIDLTPKRREQIRSCNICSCINHSIKLFRVNVGDNIEFTFRL